MYFGLIYLLNFLIFLDSLPAFDVCVWEGWMPSVRKSAQNWSPRDNTPIMLNLIEIWLEILPNWIGENLLEHVKFIFIKNLPILDFNSAHKRASG